MFVLRVFNNNLNESEKASPESEEKYFVVYSFMKCLYNTVSGLQIVPLAGFPWSGQRIYILSSGTTQRRKRVCRIAGDFGERFRIQRSTISTVLRHDAEYVCLFWLFSDDFRFSLLVRVILSSDTPRNLVH